MRPNTKQNNYKVEPIITDYSSFILNKFESSQTCFLSQSSCEWPHPLKSVKLLDNGILLIWYDKTYPYACSLYVTVHVFECYTMSTAVLMFGLDN